MKIISIACVNFNKAIGLNNNLLYKIPKELNNFKNITQLTNNSKKNAVLMGSTPVTPIAATRFCVSRNGTSSALSK